MLKVPKLTEKRKANIISILLLTVIMVASLLSRMGYFVVEPHRVIEVAIAPAIIISMIGGIPGAIFATIVWGTLSYLNPLGIHMEPILINFGAKFIALSMVPISYKIATRTFKGSSLNVYRAIVPAVLMHSIAIYALSVATGHYVINHNISDPYTMKFILDLFAQRIVPEGVVTTTLMVTVIRKLRRWHILNGVKKYCIKKPQDLGDAPCSRFL